MRVPSGLNSDDLRLGSGWGARTIELAPALSAAVHEALHRRLAALGEAARAILDVAAVASAAAPGFDIDLLRRAAGASEDQVRHAMAEALRVSIVCGTASTTDAAGYRFDPRPVAEAIYAEIALPERARLHGAVGEALAQGTASPAMLAFHFARGGDRARACHALRGAAEAARATRDYATAARQLERALALADGIAPPERTAARDDCAEQLAEILIASNRPLEAAARLSPLVARLGAPAARARRLRQLGAALLRTADPASGLAALEDALEVVGPARRWLSNRRRGAPLGEERAVLHRELALAYRWIDRERSLAHLRALVRVAGRLETDRGRLDALIATGVLCALTGRLEAAAGNRETARELARAISDLRALSRIELLHGATLALFGAEETEARSHLDQGVQIAGSIGDRFLESVAAFERGNGLMYLGRWSDAARDFPRAADLATELGASWLATAAEGRRAWLAAFHGDFAAPERTARRLQDAGAHLASPVLAALGAEILAISALLQGQFRNALVHFDRAGGHAGGGCPGWEFVTGLLAAEAALGLVDEQGPDAVPDLGARLGGSLCVIRRQPRPAMAAGHPRWWMACVLRAAVGCGPPAATSRVLARSALPAARGRSRRWSVLDW